MSVDTKVYVNLGKAIAAFERSLRIQPNALDAYAGGDTNALGIGDKTGLQAFMQVGCPQCHWGPRLTDDSFHSLKFPTGKQDGTPDRGRADVLTTLAGREFVATSKWSDAPSAAKPLAFTTVPIAMVGAIKTPSLRGVAQTAPYGHGGAFAKLEDVAKHYGQRGQFVTPAQTAGAFEIWAPDFDPTAQSQLPAILRVLKADLVP